VSTSNELGEERRVGEELVEHVVNVERERFVHDVHVEMLVSVALCRVVVVVVTSR